MNFVPAFGPQFDGFITAVLMIFSSVCLLAFLPTIITGVLCARAMAYLNSFAAIVLGIGMAISAYGLCVVLSVPVIFFNVGDEVLIATNIFVGAIVGAAGSAATWWTCLTWNRRRQKRFSQSQLAAGASTGHNV